MSASNFFKRQKSLEKHCSWRKIPPGFLAASCAHKMQHKNYIAFFLLADFCFIVNKFLLQNCLARFFRNRREDEKRKENAEEENLDKPDDRQHQYLHANLFMREEEKSAQSTLGHHLLHHCRKRKYEIKLSRRLQL